MKTEIVRMEHITKYFDDIKVLDNVRLNLYKNEILGLIGLNGSGKTILMKILLGIYPFDKGSVYIEGQEIFKPTQKLGIFYIGRQSMLIEKMSIKNNIYGLRKINRHSIFVNDKYLYNETKDLLNVLDLSLDPNTRIENLLLKEKHLIQLAIALSMNSKVIILDSITDTYSQSDIVNLNEKMIKLRDRGIGIIYINNRLDDILKNADRIFILKEGKNLRTLYRNEYSNISLLDFLGGYGEKQSHDKNKYNDVKEIFRVENLSLDGYFNNLSFSIKRGEILSLIVNQEKIRNIIGYAFIGMYKNLKGSIIIKGQKANVWNPKSAIKSGITLIPEYSYLNDLYANLNISDNLTFLAPYIINSHGIILSNIQRYLSNYYLKEADLSKYKHVNISSLGAYDRLKLIIQKRMLVKPDLLIFVNPDLGIDAVAKKGLYSILSEISQNGTAVVFIVTDGNDLTKLGNRVINLYETPLDK